MSALHKEIARRDTIGLRTIVKYDPMAPRPTTPILVGRYVVARKPIPDSVHTLYMIMDGRDVVRTQISYPSEADCESAVRAAANARTATARALAKAKRSSKKGWQARPMRVKEAA
ncbi:beta-hexosaminidase [Paraburkholderia sediminicola]|uniref:beta-hexosaminidase n=1 Tax=Paraburkholderia sediminicola TaxID=458836 RepID=UPI0038BC38F7